MEQTNTALLVMDMQEKLLGTVPGHEQVVASIAQAIAHARKNGIPVIYVAVGFRAGFPEVSSRNKNFGNLHTRMAGMNPDEWTKIAPALAPKEGEVLVVKKRFSAFAGSDLEIVLRAKGIQHLVLTGIITSGVVLSTYTEAGDKDYQLTVLSDACMDRDAQLHQVLVEKVFPKLADVVTCADWCR